VTGAYPVLHLGPVRSTRPWARTYRGTPASVPEARRFVGELLAGCPARETLMTCVSEFCANAIAHTASGRGGVFTVEVDCPRDGIARIAVTDDGGPSVPAAGRLDLMAEGGRGLAMVAASTSRWGRRAAGQHNRGQRRQCDEPHRPAPRNTTANSDKKRIAPRA
jgi:anti-sigma regulatory factor (Ser/Thr protein kinase)